MSLNPEIRHRLEEKFHENFPHHTNTATGPSLKNYLQNGLLAYHYPVIIEHLQDHWVYTSATISECKDVYLQAHSEVSGEDLEIISRIFACLDTNTLTNPTTKRHSLQFLSKHLPSFDQFIAYSQ